MPHPGSARIIGEKGVPEYAEHAGIQFLSRTAISVELQVLADQLGTSVRAQGDTILFDPPASGAAARQLGAIVSRELSDRRLKVA